jgi:alpha-galactosidase
VKLVCAWIAVVALNVSCVMSQTPRASTSTASDEVIAAPVAGKVRLDAAHPAPEWNQATPVVFCSDWQGKNPDPARQTEVRVLWSPDILYLRFVSHYRNLNLFPDAESNGRRDHLWDRDVAEAFLQPDPSRPRYYKEFEVAPNGFWIDLDITPGPLSDLKSNLQRSVWLDENNKTWVAELAIPMKALVSHFDPHSVWRANFYRIEGTEEPRSYFAWQPTRSPQPNFHVPSAFGKLRFSSATPK